MSKRNYIICAFKFGPSNGIRVAYKLYEELEKRGYNVYMFAPMSSERKCKYISEVTPEMQENDVVIYPEIISGNPLMFRHVVRWILYYPGYHGGNHFYDETDMLFTFEKEFYEGADLLTVDGIDTSIFYEDTSIEKVIDCYFVHKKGKWKEFEEFRSMTEINMHYPQTREELGNLLRKTRTLYSYDDHSLLLEEALMCGCDVKLVTESGFKDYASSYKDLVKNIDKQLDNFIKITQHHEYNGEVKKRNFNNVKFVNKIRYLKNKFKAKIYLKIFRNHEKALKYWYRAEGKLSDNKN